MLADRVCAYAMAAGGVSVIVAIVLIFFYLFYVVLPLFRPAGLEPVADFEAPVAVAADSLLLAVEEYGEIGLQVGRDGTARFFSLADGEPRGAAELPVPEDVRVTAAAAGEPASGVFALGTDRGSVLLARHVYAITYPGDVRHIEPGIEYPLGAALLELDPQGRSVVQLAVQSDDIETTVVALLDDGTLRLLSATAEQSLLEDEPGLSLTASDLPLAGSAVSRLALDLQQRELWTAVADGRLALYDVARKASPRLVDLENATGPDETITELTYLAGGVSVLVGHSSGRIGQWVPLRQDDNTYQIARLRDFASQSSPITAVVPEHFRKGFAAVDSGGALALYHTTAHRTLARSRLTGRALVQGAYNARADTLLLLDEQGRFHVQAVTNEHPEVSWQSLWGKVWYENRQQPEYIWQSSSASSDFEPKFSLTPLAFGTLKAAFYAMLFAIPLAICGAIYTAYFMSPRMRALVKPSIEVMEALPTVILGFLAGLWLAPLVEDHLPGVFLLLLTLPIAILLFAYGWRYLPPNLRRHVPPGWEALLLIPVVIVAVAVSMWLSAPMERLFFGGNMPAWITNELGLDFDQRNSLVVGFAMGFAVIPTIFSISEDAVFSVPRHLSSGSLALGATPWQTMVRIVLLTASPGIFSALMIGLGRAVGETMIVLMATGNTAIMDFNIFQGFRALSANIAVEMPESEVGSTHYRILFLAALVLFLVTFLVNTAAELVRQRLRRRYSSL